MNLIKINNATGLQHQKAHSSAWVRFGCRVFAYVAPTSYPQQDEFVRQCLLTGGNSLKRQNQLPLDQNGDIQQVALDDFNGIKEVGVIKTGWGLAYAPLAQQGEDPQSLTIKKSPRATWQSSENFPDFAQVVQQVADSQPKLILGHLRETRPDNGQTLETKNVHPFSHGDWTLMQHGDFPKKVTKGLEAHLNEWHAKDNKSPLPQGEVDSERIACYMAAKFQQQTQSVNIAKLPTEQVRAIFQQTANEIIHWPKSGKVGKSTIGPVNGGTYNLVMSDGNRVFATRFSEGCKLFKGSHRNPNGEQEFLIATDKIQPLASPGLSPIEWEEIPNNSLVTIERIQDAQGKAQVNYERTPLLTTNILASSSLFKRILGNLRSGVSSLFQGIKKLLGKIKSIGISLLNGIRDSAKKIAQWFKRRFSRNKAQ